MKLEDEERRQIENFRVRDARCARPVERMRLLEAVRAEHGSEERFDAWFRQAMPRIVLEGKQHHMWSATCGAGTPLRASSTSCSPAPKKDHRKDGGGGS